MIRRFGAPRVNGRDYVLRPGAYAILARGSELLLTFQSDPFNEFQLPGGGIDPGETPLAALHREVMEETGWKIAQPRRLGAFRKFTYMPEYDKWAEKICHIYHALPVRQISDPTEPDHQAVWTSSITASRILHNDGDQHFVARYAQSGL
ncbi:NUDIX hydrolase [Aliiroseovarius sp. CAU 1755]